MEITLFTAYFISIFFLLMLGNLNNHFLFHMRMNKKYRILYVFSFILAPVSCVVMTTLAVKHWITGPKYHDMYL